MSRKSLPDFDVTRKVPGNDLCIGCGVCAGICPSNSLEMRWSSRGELIPVKVKNCAASCGSCLRVCPFSGYGVGIDTLTEDAYGGETDVHFHCEAGYYQRCYVGSSSRQGQRLNGASGGMVTWCLETLLEREIVDAVISVIPDKDTGSDRLFRFALLSDVADVRRAARSKYYPVEISKVIRELMRKRDGKRYAVVGLPCLLNGLKLAMEANPALRRAIKYTFALVCGQLPNRFYTEFLALESGVKVNDINGVDYRIKEGTESAGNFFFRATAKDGTNGTLVPWGGAPWHLWRNGYFIHRACRYCDDVFGETADAAFMDAWLPAYSSDPRGHSLVVVRSSEICDLLEAGIADNSCKLQQIAVEDVIRSQATVVAKKRHLIRGRLYFAVKTKRWMPRRRALGSAAVYFRNLGRIHVDMAVVEESKRLWPMFREGEDTSGFMTAMASWEKKIRILDICGVARTKARKLLSDPFGVIKRVLVRLLQ